MLVAGQGGETTWDSAQDGDGCGGRDRIDPCVSTGVAVLQRSLRLYAPFYSSDILLASPLGLRTVLGAEGEKQRDFDFLSSIELLIVDQADIFLMQNWEHVLVGSMGAPEVPLSTCAPLGSGPCLLSLQGFGMGVGCLCVQWGQFHPLAYPRSVWGSGRLMGTSQVPLRDRRVLPWELGGCVLGSGLGL